VLSKCKSLYVVRKLTAEFTRKINKRPTQHHFYLQDATAAVVSLAYPEGGLGSSNPPIESSIYLYCVFATYTVQALLLYSLNPKFCIRNVNNCTLISHFILQLLGDFVS